MNAESEIVELWTLGAVPRARQAARNFTEAMGVEELQREEIALVVSELATNLVKHALGGTLKLSRVHDGTRKGMEIESLDRGPGFHRVPFEEALLDGVSSTGSLGGGLGTVSRLMDELWMTPRESSGGGTKIICRKWFAEENKERSEHHCPLQFGVATRPYPGMRFNGDDFVIHRSGERTLFAVIDALGHGWEAHSAAVEARLYIERNAEKSLLSLFQGVDRICASMRGVVMAAGRLNWKEKELEFASLGNIESRIIRDGAESTRLPIRRGYLGGRKIKPVLSSRSWSERDIIVLHSDGLTTSWRAEALGVPLSESAPAIARAMLRRFSSEQDDSTVLVVKGEKH